MNTERADQQNDQAEAAAARLSKIMQAGINQALKSQGMDADMMEEDEVDRQNRLRWLKSKDKKLLNDAFRRLRKHGYFARQDFTFCMSDGVASVPDKYATRYVFYHIQDAFTLREHGRIPEGGMHVAWAGDGSEIVSIISQTGLKAYWNGDERTRILILPAETPPEQYAQIAAEERTWKERRGLRT